VRCQGEKRKHRGFIWDLYVEEAQRGKGIGKALMSELLCRASSQADLDRLTLTVESGNTVAIGLYSSLGFKVYGREVRALRVGQVYVDQDMMVLTCPFLCR
jgi:ribosomal protein S18 acetylase RimI-like enzyme